MKGFLIAAAFGLGVLGATVPTAGSALASGEDEHRIYGGNPMHKYFGALLYGAPRDHYRPGYRRGHRDYRPAHRHAYRHGHRKRHAYSAQGRPYRQRQMDYQVVRPCRPTSKIGFDDYGRRARIGGTMCYDAYGRPYIVQGSRYIIQYF